jgi:hypothetical protein
MPAGTLHRRAAALRPHPPRLRPSRRPYSAASSPAASKQSPTGQGQASGSARSPSTSAAQREPSPLRFWPFLALTLLGSGSYLLLVQTRAGQPASSARRPNTAGPFQEVPDTKRP